MSQVGAGIGIANLPNQRHKIVAKRGANFTLMVCGMFRVYSVGSHVGEVLGNNALKRTKKPSFSFFSSSSRWIWSRKDHFHQHSVHHCHQDAKDLQAPLQQNSWEDCRDWDHSCRYVCLFCLICNTRQKTGAEERGVRLNGVSSHYRMRKNSGAVDAWHSTTIVTLDTDDWEEQTCVAFVME